MRSSSSRTNNYRPQFNPIICKGDRLSYENQIRLKERIDNQNWERIWDAHFTKFGRGFVSVGKLEKDTIFVDNHGKVITGQKFEEYVQQPDVTSEFVMEVAGPPKRLIDASSAICVDHPTNLCNNKNDVLSLEV